MTSTAIHYEHTTDRLSGSSYEQQYIFGGSLLSVLDVLRNEWGWHNTAADAEQGHEIRVTPTQVELLTWNGPEGTRTKWTVVS